MKGKLYLAPDGKIVTGINVNFKADRDSVYSVMNFSTKTYTFCKGDAINLFKKLPKTIIPLLDALWK